MLGVLVLDKDLATAAFTPERLSALRVLATRAAIALDNAMLQSELQTSLQELHCRADGLADPESRSSGHTR